MKALEVCNVEIGSHEMAKAFEENGYVYIRSFFSPEEISELQGVIYHALEKKGWGVVDNGWVRPTGEVYRIGSKQFIDIIETIMQEEAVHLFSYNKKMHNIVTSLLGEAIFTHPRKMVRISYPYSMNPNDRIPAHQDVVYVKGEVDTLIAWTPLASYPPEYGGLCVAQSSHKHGLFPVEANEEGRFGCSAANLDEAQLDWRYGDYREGDLLLMHALTLHKAGTNNSPYFRLSIDCRYSSAQGYINEEQLLPPYYPKVSSWETLAKSWSYQKLFSPPDTIKVDKKELALSEIMNRKSIFC